MKVFQDFMSKLDSIEKHDSLIDNNFGNLCVKKGEKKKVLIFSVVNGGILIPETPRVRTPLIPKAIIQFESGSLIPHYSFSNCVDHAFEISKIKIM